MDTKSSYDKDKIIILCNTGALLEESVLNFAHGQGWWSSKHNIRSLLQSFLAGVLVILYSVVVIRSHWE